MRNFIFIAPLAALAISACATTTARTDGEQALAVTMEDSGNIIPATTEERAAIHSRDLLSQAAFWAEAYDLNPSDQEAALELSIALRRMGNHDRSAIIAQQALALYPEDADM